MPSIRSTRDTASQTVAAAEPSTELKIDAQAAASVATIAGTATAVPPHLLTREIVKHHMKGVFSLEGKHLEAIHTVIDNSQIDQRHSVFPVEYIIEPRPLSQINNEYRA